MGALFGTDGIRGIVNQTLDAPLAYRVGQAAALVLAEQSNGRPLFLIGKDTRISSDLLEDALTAGLLACGADVMSPVSYTHLDVYKRQPLNHSHFSAAALPAAGWKAPGVLPPDSRSNSAATPEPAAGSRSDCCSLFVFAYSFPPHTVLV